MKIANIKHLSLVDGPGPRTAIFTTGCIHNCEGCHNPEYQNYKYGVEWEPEEIIEEIKLVKNWIKGITLTGGDPLFQLDNTKELLKLIRKDTELKHINIMLYTGYLFEDIPGSIKQLVDVIIDGKYDKNLPRAYMRGSCNQRMFKKIMNTRFEIINQEEDVRDK